MTTLVVIVNIDIPAEVDKHNRASVVRDDLADWVVRDVFRVL